MTSLNRPKCGGQERSKGLAGYYTIDCSFSGNSRYIWFHQSQMREAFTDDQLAKLSPFLGDVIAGDRSFFISTYYMYFPFLACEVKCGAAGLDVADRQNAHSMALAVRAIAELFRAVKREGESISGSLASLFHMITAPWQGEMGSVSLHEERLRHMDAGSLQEYMLGYRSVAMQFGLRCSVASGNRPFPELKEPFFVAIEC
ncbi:unnamed protein product, partial [Clonostachys chloroleuca]